MLDEVCSKTGCTKGAWQWSMFLPKNKPAENKFHPTDRTIDTLANTGVKYIQVPAGTVGQLLRIVGCNLLWRVCRLSTNCGY